MLAYEYCRQWGLIPVHVNSIIDACLPCGCILPECGDASGLLDNHQQWYLADVDICVKIPRSDYMQVRVPMSHRERDIWLGCFWGGSPLVQAGSIHLTSKEPVFRAVLLKTDPIFFPRLSGDPIFSAWFSGEYMFLMPEILPTPPPPPPHHPNLNFTSTNDLQFVTFSSLDENQ